LVLRARELLGTHHLVLQTLIQTNGVQIRCLQEGRKVHNEKLHTRVLHAIGPCPVGLTSVFEVRIMRWARHVTRTDVMRN
jgi:hypothetical protein